MEYEIRENCKIGSTTVKRDDYDVLKAVFLYLGDAVEGQENNALRLLDIIRSDEMTHDEKIATMGEEVTEMCNWSKGVKEAAMEKGLQQGLAAGKLAQMLKVFLKQISKGASFEDAADTAGAETPTEIEYLREHMPA